MKNLKEESKKFVAEVLGLGGVQDIMISKVEAFARRVRVETLEESARLAESHGKLWGENRGTENPSTVPEDEIAKSIRGRKDAW